MPSFAKKFNFTQERSAEEAYSKLIESSSIVLARRQHLKREYNTLQTKKARQYWESVQFKLSLKSTTRKAAATTAKASLKEIQAEYSTYKACSVDQPNEHNDLSSSSAFEISVVHVAPRLNIPAIIHKEDIIFPSGASVMDGIVQV
ncbi:hypothetical protein EDD21DRAFT_402416 [Dissophora ornata]|nr:hypothetical protein EDD21DRAFT_402416 [Dissophora ornata]